MISISKNFNFDPKCHKLFSAIGDLSWPQLGEIITKNVWSPIVWRGGVRNSKNYERCDNLVLDFDDGWPNLEDIIISLKYDFKLTHIVQLTKSHMKQKGPKPPCDRFRVIAPIERPITDLEEYMSFMSWAHKVFVGSDPSTKDGARFYFPGGPVLSLVDLGGRVRVRTLPYPQKREVSLDYQNGSARKVPAWILGVLRTGFANRRNNRTCNIASRLFRLGVDQQEIERLILDSNISLSKAEKLRCIRNAKKYI